MFARSDLGRRLCIPLLAAAAVVFGAPAQAQDWPQRPVRIIGPYAAGGNADVLARLTAQRLSEAFGQQFMVENRVGGNGVIAAEAVARAAPDGYTLMWGVLPPVAIQPAMTKVPYDPIKDFAPISVVGTNPFVLVVNKDVPAKSVKEFIAWVKSQPGKLSYAEGAVGSLTHLAMALFLKRAGIEMTNVSYRGNAPALTDVVAGHVPTMFSNVSDALPQIQAGSIRALAVSSDTRVPQLPDVPTVAGDLPRLQRHHLERPDGARRHAEADHRQDGGRDRARLQGPGFHRQACKPRRRSARQHAGAVRGTDRGRPQDLDGGGDSRGPQREVAARRSALKCRNTDRPILIAGGGPVGVITALALARQGLPVHVFEAEAKVNDMPRAATTHAATLEMLAGLGMVDEVIERGLVEPLFRIWDRPTGKLIAEFDFGMLKDETRYPFAVQCEQHKLAGMAIERLRGLSHAKCRILRPRDVSLEQFSDRVEIEVETADGTRKVAGSYLIGADGGRSTVRKALDIEFEGYTHPERFMILTTTFDIGTRYPGCTRNYISDPEAWFSLFKVSGDDGKAPVARAVLDHAARADRGRTVRPRGDRAAAAAVPAQGRAATTSSTAISTTCISGWRRASARAACSSRATPPTSTIRSAGWASISASTTRWN